MEVIGPFLKNANNRYLPGSYLNCYHNWIYDPNVIEAKAYPSLQNSHTYFHTIAINIEFLYALNLAFGSYLCFLFVYLFLLYISDSFFFHWSLPITKTYLCLGFRVQRRYNRALRAQRTHLCLFILLQLPTSFFTSSWQMSCAIGCFCVRTLQCFSPCSLSFTSVTGNLEDILLRLLSDSSSVNWFSL